MKSIKQILAIATLTVIASSALAGSGTENVTVTYEDLNIQSQAGAQVLYRRLESAAEHVCGATHYRQPISLKTVRERCVRDKLSAAVEAVNSEVLTSIHNS